MLPIHVADVDRSAARRAIALSPVVGGLLGGGAAGLAWVLRLVELPSMLVGLVCVAFLLLMTRGMHIDGLADTMDGLGCYGPPERAREVMRSGGAGPFGVAAVVVAIAAQAAAFGTLAYSGRWLAIVGAVVAGRIAVVIACGWRMGAAAPDSRFGGLVAESQFLGTEFAWALVVLPFLTIVALPEQHWWIPTTIAAFVPLLASVLLVRHCVRRFGGLSGDVLGAALEVTVTLYAVIACFGTA